MRVVVIASLIALSSAAYADDDARAIMRQSAIDQAETMPATVPSAEASATAKSRADGQQGRTERAAHSASAAARKAAVNAARDVAATGALPRQSVPSTARSAGGRNSTADATARGASSIAREHTVRAGGHPGGGGRP